MQATRASLTAEQMALSRAIETRKPAAERICNDPLAERFLSGKYRFLLLGRSLRDAVEKLIEALFTGHHYYVIARTRYIDDFLLQQLAGKPGQLVILGAGFDSRAHRFAGQLQDVRVFELDHPATSQAKQSKIRSVLGSAADPVTYVPVDFGREKLADRLHQSGYQDGVRTVFLWEGVTPYLNDEAVDEVLRFIRHSGAPGSSLLFDYILRSVVDGSCTLPGARNEYAKMQRSSEPLSFGIAEGAIADFLAARGFTGVVDVGSRELRDRYFVGPNKTRCVKPWWRIVHAMVPARE